MKILKNKIYAVKLTIIDSFVDLGLFTQGKIMILNRAAIIPLEEYAALLHTAEQFEKLTMLKPLADAIKRRELKIMEDAAYDEEKG